MILINDFLDHSALKYEWFLWYNRMFIPNYHIIWNKLNVFEYTT